MKIFFRFILFLFFITLFISNTNASKNKILFKINNSIITSIDIANEIKYLDAINPEFSKLEKQKVFEIAKKSLVKEKIKRIELEKFFKELEIEDEILNKFLFNYFKELGLKSEKDFDNYFLTKSVDPTIVKQKISQELLWNQLVYRRYIKSVKIDINKIKKELNNNNKEKEYLLQEVLFTLNKDEILIDKFEDIKKNIKEKSFSEVALEYSISSTNNQGGKLDWIKASVLSEKIKKELQKIKVGEFTSPIVLPGGFLILKINNIRMVEKKIDLEKELNFIVDQKTNKQLNQFSNIYFQKIKQNTKINEL